MPGRTKGKMRLEKQTGVERPWMILLAKTKNLPCHRGTWGCRDNFHNIDEK